VNFLFEPISFWVYVAGLVGWSIITNLILHRVFRTNPIIGRINLILMVPIIMVGLGSFLSGWVEIPGWIFLLIILSFGGVGYIIPVYFFMKAFLVKDLNTIIAQTRDMADGRANLSQRIKIQQRDEIGYIGQNINTFLGQMENLAKTIRLTAVSGKDLGNDLSSSAEEMGATLIQMERTLESLVQNIGKLDDEQIKARSSVQEIIVEMTNSNAAVEEQANWVSQSSASVEQMAANISSIANVTKDKRGLSDQLAEVAHEGEKDLMETLQSMEGISQSAGVIFDLIKIINAVAAQTNLLAMNAAIEAAHAGDAGRGFAVVADEIRKLAETTAGNAKNISQSLKGIMGQINDTTKVTKKTTQRITAIFEGIEEMSSAMRETLAGLQELNVGAKQIVQTFINLNRLTGDVKGSSQNVARKTTTAQEASQQVSQLSQEARNGIGEVLIGVKEVRRASGNLTQLSEKNADNISSLEKLAQRFKTEA